MDNSVQKKIVQKFPSNDSEISSSQSKSDIIDNRAKNKRNTINYNNPENIIQDLEKQFSKNIENKNTTIKTCSTKNNPKINYQSLLGLHSHSSENLRKIDELNSSSDEKTYPSDDEDEKMNNKLNKEKNNKNENNNIIQKQEENKNKIDENLKILFNSRGKNTSEEDDIQSCQSINTEFELNYYRNSDMIRNAYFSQLIVKRVWEPSQKPKTHNSLIIFDWDDTLLPTSFLAPGGVFNENLELSEKDKAKIKKLEESVLKLLTISISKGDVFIITNAGVGWVEFSAEKFYPSICEILKKVEIISARGEYEDKFPGDSRRWKIQTFLNLLKKLNIKLVTNIICLGDSVFEIEAGRVLASKFTQAFIKTIKFREKPKPEELQKQLSLVIHKFNAICSSVKNLTVRVEKKKKKD